MKKYLTDGELVEVVSEVAGGFLVQHYYTDYYPGNEFDYDDNEVDESRLMLDDRKVFVGNVFDNPPTEKLAKEVTELKEEIKKLLERKSKIHSEIVQAEKEKIARLKKLKKFEQLKYIEDFIEDKITHYVFFDNYSAIPKILSIDEAKCQYDRAEPRLLGLYGKKCRDIEWRLHHYSDGSGGFTGNVYPVTSLKQAIEKASKLLNDKINSDEKLSDYEKVRMSEFAKKFEIEVTAEFHKEAKAAENRIKAGKIEELQKKKKDIEKEINEIKEYHEHK